MQMLFTCPGGNRETKSIAPHLAIIRYPSRNYNVPHLEIIRLDIILKIYIACLSCMHISYADLVAMWPQAPFVVGR